MARSSATPRSPHLDLALVLFVATVLRLMHLTGQSLWTDELLRMTWVRGIEIAAAVDVPPAEIGRHAPVKGLRQALEVVNRHNPPGQAVLLNRYLAWFEPDSDFTLRLPFVLLGILSVLGAMLTARELAGRSVGLAVGLLVAFSPFQIAYVQEVNHYAVALFFTTFGSWFFIRYLKRNQVVDGVLWAVCGVLGLYTHYYVGLVLAAQAVGMIPWLSGSPRRNGALLAPLAAMLLAFVPYVPHVLFQAAELTSDVVSGVFGGWAYFEARVVDEFVFPWLGLAATHLPAGIAGLVAICFARLIYLGVKSEPQRRTQWLLGAGVVVPALMMFATYWGHHNNTHLWPRYGLFFTPALYLPLGLLIARSRSGLRLAAVTLTVASMGGGLWFFYAKYKKEDWRGAAALINSSAVAGEAIVVSPYNLTPALAHYLTVQSPVSSLSNLEQLPSIVERLAANEGVFLVRAWDGSSVVPDLLDDALSCRFEERHITRFFGLQVTHLRRQVGGGQPGGQCARSSVPVVEGGGCWLEAGVDSLDVSGSVLAPAGPQQVEFIDALSGDKVGSANLEAVVDGASTPVERRYRTSLALAALPVGLERPLMIRLVRGRPPLTLGRQLLCLRRPPQTARPGKLVERADVDAPLHTVQGQPMQVTGWAFSSMGVRAVVLRVDGVEAARTRAHGIYRADVAFRYPELDQELAAFSGYSETLDTHELAPGEHTLTAEVVHLDGTIKRVERSLAFKILPKVEKRTAERGYLESATVSEKGTRLTLKGWAFSSVGEGELKISIDGQEFKRRAAATDDRQDVSSHFPEFEPELTKHSGFTETLDTARLAPGPHTVRVEMVHPDQTTAPVDNPLPFTR